jgi:hypothetical protein
MALSRLEVMVSLVLVPIIFIFECIRAPRLSALEDRGLYRIIQGDLAFSRVLLILLLLELC